MQVTFLTVSFISQKILEAENLANVDVDTLMVILNQDQLWINNEICLFGALEKYAKANSLSRDKLDAVVHPIFMRPC